MAAEIRFETSGEDFIQGGASNAARILREIQESILRGEESGKIYDSDYEPIGSWEISFPWR